MGRKTANINSVEESSLSRVARIVHKLRAKSDALKELDETRLLHFVWSILCRSRPGELTGLSDDQLAPRIKKVMLVEALSSMLEDLTPGETEAFDASVKRREFF